VRVGAARCAPRDNQFRKRTRRDAVARDTLALVGVLLALVVVNLAGARTTGVAAVDAANPAELVDSVAHTLLTAIDAHRDEYRSDPTELDSLVRRVVLPHFDTKLAAQLVLARHWDDADLEQRRRFIDAFYHSVLHNYGAELVDFNLDRLRVLPYRGNPGANYATVNTWVRRRNGEQVEVDYSLHRTGQGWKVYDVTISGVSYLLSFRDDFGEEIEQKGLNELISRLEGEYEHVTPTKND
jgi:phospholipid transport system substrate-binding protein